MKRLKRVFMGILALAMIAVFIPVSSVSADENDVYNITYSLTGVTTSSMVTSISSGSTLSMIFTADDGYELPETITVNVNGNEMTDGYTYDGGTLIIDEVYGDLEIIVTGVSATEEDSRTYSIVYDLYMVDASKQDGNVAAGTEYSVKLTPRSGYRLQNTNVGVSMNGEDITSGYSYNDGVLTITSVEGDIVITAVATPRSSSNDNNNKNNSSNSSKNNNNSNSSSGGSSSGSSSNSKSAQAMQASGGSPSNYNSGSYSAPRTGDDGLDIRFLGAAALICMGTGCMLFGRKRSDVR